MDLYDLLVLLLLAFAIFDLCSRPSRGKWDFALTLLEGLIIACLFASLLVFTLPRLVNRIVGGS